MGLGTRWWSSGVIVFIWCLNNEAYECSLCHFNHNNDTNDELILIICRVSCILQNVAFFF